MHRPPTIALLVAIALFALPGSALCADGPDLATAHATLARGAIPEAITLYTEVLQEGSLTGQPLAIAYRERGIAQQKAGFTRHAIADYTNALWLDVLPSQLKAETYLGRGVAYLELGQLTRADQDFAHALANDPGLAEAYFGRGTVKRLSGMPQDAIADYGRTLRLKSARPELVYYARGLAYEALGKRDSALADYREAAALAPGLEAVRAKLTGLGLPLPLLSDAPAPRAAASPTSITLADAGDVLFAQATSAEPTGAIPSQAPEAAPAAAASRMAANEPSSAPVPSGASSSDIPVKPPSLRPGTDGPLSPENEAKRATPQATEPNASPGDGTQETTPASKPAAGLDATSNESRLASLGDVPPQTSEDYLVQVAAYFQKDSADKGLEDFSARFPDFVKTARLFIETASLPDKGTAYRLRAGPFDSAEAAEAACSKLGSQGQDCLVVPPRRTAQN